MATFLNKGPAGEHQGQDQQPSLPQLGVDLSEHAQGTVAAVQDIQTGNDVIGSGFLMPCVYIQHPAQGGRYPH